jgi:hypothetical protein
MAKDRFHNNFVVGLKPHLSNAQMCEPWGLHHEAKVKATTQMLSKNMLKHIVEKKPIHSK